MLSCILEKKIKGKELIVDYSQSHVVTFVTKGHGKRKK
jgi:hypothetical protein